MSNDPSAPNTTRRSLQWALIALFAAALLGIALYKTWPILHPATLVQVPLDPACDLRAGPCRAAFPQGGVVRFGIEPREIPVMRPLSLQVELAGLDPGGVEVDFSGVDMNMGYNRVRLARTAPGRFEGEVMLPVCVRDRMDWEALVLLETADGRLGAPFRFETRSR